MTNKLKAMLDDAKELNALGLMPESDVAEISKLLKARELKTRIAAVKMMSGEEIKAVRVRFGMSQSILAHTLGMSKESVSKWERNEIKPSGPALRILNTLAAKGPEVFTK
ncbi:MAG: helix-turn-helix domain-containing protein [Kluyvera sp.]|uniref:helix-turn-helix domain-containing protein n=1 Tax=Kluyvera sp. TaxID=1538228 RepID=UPI003A85EF96